MLPNKSPKVANFLRLFFFLVGISLVFWQIELNYIIISLNTIFPCPSKVSHYLLSMYRVSHTKAFSGRGGCEVTLHPFFSHTHSVYLHPIYSDFILLKIPENVPDTCIWYIYVQCQNEKIRQRKHHQVGSEENLRLFLLNFLFGIGKYLNIIYSARPPATQLCAGLGSNATR